MNILISTTTNWNPGDEFIRFGVMHLLGSQHNYLFYDRNPDFFNSKKWEMDNRPFKSNVFNNDIPWDLIDAVVLAGSPEWMHGPLKYIYEGLNTRPHIPLYCIGVGYSMPSFIGLTDIEREVLKRETTKIICRDENTKNNAVMALGREDITVLPCPAFFAANHIRLPHHSLSSGKTLYIPQSTHGEQSIVGSDIVNIPEQSDILTYYKNDFLAYPKGMYIHDPIEILRKINTYDYVITNRLHTAITAIGMGKIVKITNSSIRVQNTMKEYESVLNNEEYHDEDLVFQTNTYNKYKKLLTFFQQ